MSLLAFVTSLTGFSTMYKFLILQLLTFFYHLIVHKVMWKQPGHEASYQSIALYVVPPVFGSMKVEVLLVVIVGFF